MVPIQLDTANLIGGSVTGPARTITTNYNASSEVVSVVDPNSTVGQKRTGTAIDGRCDFGKLWGLFRFFVLGFLL